MFLLVKNEYNTHVLLLWFKPTQPWVLNSIYFSALQLSLWLKLTDGDLSAVIDVISDRYHVESACEIA